MLRSLKSQRFKALIIVLGSIAPALSFGQAIDVNAAVDKASSRVELLLTKFSDVKCTEEVVQQKFNKGGHVEYSERETYDYLIMLQGDKDELLLNESRLQDKDHSAASRQNLPLLLTNGFSSLFLIFHPYYRSSFRFDFDGIEQVGNQRLMRIRFSHLPNSRTPAALAVRGHEYPLELTGVAWVDPATGIITRIDSSLQNDMKDVGLRALSAQVEYSAVTFAGWKTPVHLPATATIDVESLRQHWRNTHRFRNYMQFTVDTQINPSEAKVK